MNLNEKLKNSTHSINSIFLGGKIRVEKLPGRNILKYHNVSNDGIASIFGFAFPDS